MAPLISTEPSCVSFDLLLFVVKSGRKGKDYHLKDPGPLHLTKNQFVRIFRQSYRAGGKASLAVVARSHAFFVHESNGVSMHYKG